VELGLRILQLSSDAMRTLVEGIAKLASVARRDGCRHDFGMEFAGIGLTIHANPAPDPDAREFLHAHCTVKKHQRKANTWYGLLIDPVSERIRDALRLSYPWEQDDDLDQIATTLRPTALPAQGLAGAAVRKIGRNDPCPCGSDRKWKVCCRP
jgi:hypothetical protein